MLTASTGLWKNRNYKMFLQAATVSNLGDGIALLTLPWLVSMITQDAAKIAMLTATLRLPWLLCSLPVGLMADRFDRRSLMLWANALRLIILSALIAGLIYMPSTDQLTSGQAHAMIYSLTAIAFILGITEVLHDNTSQILLPALVPEQQLETANGQLWSAEQLIGQFVGPPLAGWLILQSNATPFVVNALCVALAWYFVYLIRLPKHHTTPASTSIWLQLREAFAWLYAHTQMFRLALMVGAYNFFVTGMFTMLILFSQHILGLNAAQYGLLLTAGAVAAWWEAYFAQK